MQPEEYLEQPYPHPYLIIWLECKRYGDGFSGMPALPDPSVGWLDQDADLLLAFEVLDELQHTREEEEKRRAQLKEQAGTFFQTRPSSLN